MSSAVNSPQDPHHHDDGTARRPGDDDQSTRHVVARQRERFGGMKFGACFFGWLTATGTTVLLTALVAAVGAGIGIGPDAPIDPSSTSVETVGLVGAIALLVIIFVGYAAGGYVAGRMSRFNGAKQGVGVWLWAIIVAVVVAVLSLIVGAQVDVLSRVSGFIPVAVNWGTLSTEGIVTAVSVIAVALAGAVVGGLAGMRFHRRIDRATHEPTS